MRVVHFSDTEFTTLPESLPVLARLDGTQIVLSVPGRSDRTLHFYLHEAGFDERSAQAKFEYDRFIAWLRGGDENSEFRFVLKVPQAGEVQDTPAFLKAEIGDRKSESDPADLSSLRTPHSAI